MIEKNFWLEAITAEQWDKIKFNGMKIEFTKLFNNGLIWFYSKKMITDNKEPASK